MAVFKLPRIQANIPIVDAAGKALSYFLRFLDEAFERIEKNEAAQQQVIDAQAVLIQQIQAQQEQINAALELAGIAVGGSSANSQEDISYTGWTLGPQVDLTGVVAGDLMINGTNLQPIAATRLSAYPGDQVGQVRIVEIVGGIDTVIGGPWNFVTARDENPNSVPYIGNPPEIATFNPSLTTTGAVSYRLDAIMTDFAVEMTDVRFYLFVKRS